MTAPVTPSLAASNAFSAARVRSGMRKMSRKSWTTAISSAVGHGLVVGGAAVPEDSVPCALVDGPLDIGEARALGRSSAAEQRCGDQAAEESGVHRCPSCPVPVLSLATSFMLHLGHWAGLSEMTSG